MHAGMDGCNDIKVTLLLFSVVCNSVCVLASPLIMVVVMDVTVTDYHL